MTFDEECIRTAESVISAVNKCVELDGRDFAVVMDEVVAHERKSHDAEAAKKVAAAKDGPLGPGVKEFRELIR